MKRLLREGKAEIELAVTKCLTGAKLTPSELNEVCAVGESDLMRDYGCDLYMAETVKLHAKREMLRLRAQNQFTRMEGLWNEDGYPNKPFTRTDYIKESRRRLREDHHEEDRSHHGDGRMMDYGHNKSDAEEGRMMKQVLRDIAVDAYRLHQMLEDGDDLPQWCQYKTAQAQQMVGSVRDYLEYKLERAGEDPVGEEEMFDPEEMEDDFGEESTEMAMDAQDYEDDYDVEEPEDDDYETGDYKEDVDSDDSDDDSSEIADYDEGMKDSDDTAPDYEEDEGYDSADVKMSLEKTSTSREDF